MRIERPAFLRFSALSGAFSAICAWLPAAALAGAIPLPVPSAALTQAPEKWTVKIQSGTDGQEVWVSNNTSITTPAELGTIGTVPKGTRVFHWGPVSDVDRWRRQGTIDQGELDAMINGFGAEGGGFYFSQSITDTMAYGPGLLIDDIVEDVKSVVPTTPVTVDANLTHALAAQGIWAIENYGGTDWMNIIDLNALKQFTAPTFQIISQNVDLSQATLNVLFQLDANAALDLSDPKLASNPAIAQLKSGMSQGTLPGTLQGLFLMGVEHPGGTPFFNLLKNVAEPQVKTTYQPLIDAVWKANPFSYVYTDFQDPMNISNLSANLQIPMSEIAPDSSLTNPIAAVPFGPGSQNLPPYLKNLDTAIESLNFDDLARKMAEGDPTPWTAEDQPGKPALLSSWQKTTDPALSFAAYNDSALPAVNQVFTGSSAVPAFRDGPLIAGGPVVYKARGYYRITAHQKAVLESNPLLVTNIVADPSHSGEFLARYEFPSAETYAKFKSLLSADLASKLDAARAAGTLTPGTADFKTLTQSIITELMTQSANAPVASLKYQIQMAIQPFQTDSGITLRAQYARVYSGSVFPYSPPIFLKDGNAPFLMTPYEFSIEMQNGASQYNRIMGGWISIFQQNSADPQYFNSPDFWAVSQNMQSLPSDDQSVVSEGESYFRNPKNATAIQQRELRLFDNDLSNCDKALMK